MSINKNIILFFLATICFFTCTKRDYEGPLLTNLYGEFDKFDPIKGHFVGALIEKIIKHLI